MTPLPRLIVTGASGFIGRHLLEAVKEDYRIFGLARRSQARSGAPVHPNISWFQVDIGEREALERVMGKIREGGGADILIHLAAHYDFTGDKHPEYRRTNVHGLENVLDLSWGLGLKRFVFSSSLAACKFPAPGEVLDETAEPDGEHIYAVTKCFGERVLRKYESVFPSTIVRFAALFSDWCEYPPLFMMLGTWLSKAWNARILAGDGESAIPYLHIRDGVSFLRTVMDRIDEPAPGEVLNATVDGSVSHRELFEEAAGHYFGYRRRPLLMPKPLCAVGLHAMNLAGRITGHPPFERPWMVRYIDKKLSVDGRRTRERLGWSPRTRLELPRRMPFLLENLKMDPLEWGRRNRAAMKQVRLRANLKIHGLLEKHEKEIHEIFLGRIFGPEGANRFPTYQRVTVDQHQWNIRLIHRQLMNAIRTQERGVFLRYCRDLARLRFEQGFHAEEVCRALDELNDVCLQFLFQDPDADDLRDLLTLHITMTIRFGSDEIQDTFEELTTHRARARKIFGETETPRSKVVG